METNKTTSVEQEKENAKTTNKQLVSYYDVPKTPFTICRKQEEEKTKYYITCHGRAMTYAYNSLREAKDAIKYHSWDLLTAFIFLISEIQSTSKTEKK